MVTPEDILAAVRQSKEIAESSKQAVQPPPANPSTIDPQWQAVQRQRSSK